MSDQKNDMNPYSAADIEKYWKGQLSPEAMHAMERAALEDPFLADAMDGYRQLENTPPNKLTADLSELDIRLEKRIADETPKTIHINWWKPAIAALFIVTAAAAGYYFWKPTIHADLVKSKPPVIQPVIVAPENADNVNEMDSTVIMPADVAVLDKEKKRLPDAPKASSTNKTTIQEPQAEKESGIAIVSPQPAPENKAPIVAIKEPALVDYRGVVLNEAQQPVAGAIINLKGRVSAVSVVTDTLGRFHVPVVDSSVQLTVSVVGYQSDKYQLSALDSTNDIAINLKPSNSALNEVVVTGYGAKKNAAPIAANEVSKDLSVKVQDAVPIPGWNVYNTYLMEKQVVPDSLKNTKGNVVVSFVVTTNGKLSSFIIEQSLSPYLDREAIRLVKEGPAWKILKGRKVRVIVIVPF